MDGQIEIESIRLSFVFGAMHLGINQLTINPEIDTVNQATRSVLHLVYNTIIAWKLSIMEVIRLVPDSRRSERLLHLERYHYLLQVHRTSG
jgi:hypothetical protein